MAIDSKFFEERHPSHDGHAELWRRCYMAYRGGPKFKEQFLKRHEGEGDADKAERLARCSYENHTRDIIERFASILFSRKIDREPEKGNKDRYEEINENIDLRGTRRDDWIRRVAWPLTSVFGWLPVLVDMPKGEAETELQREELGLQPYVVPILPPRFLNWSVDGRGQLEWALFERKRREADPEEGVVEVRQFRLVDKVSTRVFEERKGKKGTEIVEVEEVEHNLGIVPIVTFYDQRQADEDLVGYPSIQDAVDQSIELFNVMSEKREVAHKTLFNMLAAPDDAFSGEEERETIVGPHWIFRYNQEGSPPEWISAPVEPVSELREEIATMRRRIYELAGLDAGHVEEKREELSGVAYTLRRKPTEDKAIRLGRSFEDAENALDVMIMRVFEEDANFEPNVRYPKRYAVRDTQATLEQLRLVEESSTLPPKVKAKMASRIVYTEDFSEYSDDELEAMEQEIEAFDPQVEEVAQARKLREAEVEPEERLVEKQIAMQKQHGHEMAQKNIETAKINQETQLKLKEMELAEAERARAAAPKEEKKSAWGDL